MFTRKRRVACLWNVCNKFQVNATLCEKFRVKALWKQMNGRYTVLLDTKMVYLWITIYKLHKLYIVIRKLLVIQIITIGYFYSQAMRSASI